MLVVSQTAVYALRAMAHLASAGEDRAISSSELTEAVGIPPHYVSKVLRRLVVAGLCDAKRGHHGGFRLSKPAEDISFTDIIEAADPEQAPIGCAFGYGKCDLACPCPLHESWAALKDRFQRWSDETMLSHVRDFAARPEVRRGPPPRG